jgi:aspartyl aminopeptidase
MQNTNSQSSSKTPKGAPEKDQTARDLMGFIARSPTPFHVVENACKLLKTAAYTEQKLDDTPCQGGQYYVRRNASSLIVVSLNAPLEQGFSLVGAHTDSPCLKLKPDAAYEKQGYLQLGVEVYGGALLAPWFDRDLSLAGRLTAIDKNGKLLNRLVDFQRPIGTVPSLAIHLNREVNEKNEINRQNHLPPILGFIGEEPDLQNLLLKQLAEQCPGEVFDSVLAFELSLYDTQAPAIIGLQQDLIASARLDNLLSSYIGLRAMLAQKQQRNCVLVLSDHEEVGSASAAGAGGPFLESVLRQICGSEATYRKALDKSLLVSVDNAHAVHPNYVDRHEPKHQPRINGGPVIKINHNQRYATNSETQAFFAHLCQKQGVPYQTYVVRSDMGCGSTIGPITATELGVRTVDVGAPQLAMHSIRELAGVADCSYLLEALTVFYNAALNFDEAG